MEINYIFIILSDTSNFDRIIQNLKGDPCGRVTHVEGVLVHITHPVCMVACAGET